MSVSMETLIKKIYITQTILISISKQERPFWLSIRAVIFHRCAVLSLQRVSGYSYCSFALQLCKCVICDTVDFATLLPDLNKHLHMD